MNTKRPRVIQVIESEISRGEGIRSNPHRTVVQYHTLDGEWLAETDVWAIAAQMPVFSDIREAVGKLPDLPPRSAVES